MQTGTVTVSDDPSTPDVDETGQFIIESLPAGSHSVRHRSLFNHIRTSPTSAIEVSVEAESNSDGHLFGQTILRGDISGVLWDDADGDRRQDSGESLLPNRTVYLDVNGNESLDPSEPSTTTLVDDPETAEDETGTYHLDQIVPGSYQVRQVLPHDWQQTSPLAIRPQTLRFANGYQAGRNTGTFPYYDAAVSSQGSVVALTTGERLLPQDIRANNDLYVFQSETQQILMGSVSSAGAVSSASSYNPAISEDGRWIVFRSFGSNLVSGDSNGTWDIFLRDQQTGDVTLVSRAMTSTANNPVVGNSFSYNPAISGDGRYISYWSNSSDLVPDDTNALFDLFLFDRIEGTTRRINLTADGQQATGGRTHDSQLSRDGRYVVFWSTATNLAANDTNNGADVFRVDLQSGAIDHVTTSSTGEQANGEGFDVGISDNGRFVSFRSDATNLSPLATNGDNQVYLKDMLTGEVSLISIGADGLAGNDYSGNSSISGNGRYITFESDATNLVSDDTNNERDAFIHDRLTGLTTRLSQSRLGVEGNARSDYARISRDGSTVVFTSAASNLLSSPITNGGLYAVSVDQVLGRTPSHHVLVEPGQSLENIDFGSRFVDQTAPTTVDITPGDPTSRSIVREVTVTFDETVVDNFYRLFGDTDADRDVDGQDYGRFGLTFLRSTGESGFDSRFDADNDGGVDGQDYGRFGLRFLMSLPPA